MQIEHAGVVIFGKVAIERRDGSGARPVGRQIGHQLAPLLGRPGTMPGGAQTAHKHLARLGKVRAIAMLLYVHHGIHIVRAQRAQQDWHRSGHQILSNQ
ncbi:hypothetical protein SDC9_153203 [bioreactor metagenome]|uniref:Uncharacterized protein n=1 Tax=bioreactor metagenome TaxID=1076179 RepID=A0A645EXQ3_9ZZZZ